MTMRPMWKTCPKCHKRYSWNPDVGKIACPRCYRRKGIKELINIITNREKEV